MGGGSPGGTGTPHTEEMEGVGKEVTERRVGKEVDKKR